MSKEAQDNTIAYNEYKLVKQLYPKLNNDISFRRFCEFKKEMDSAKNNKDLMQNPVWAYIRIEDIYGTYNNI